MIDYDAPQAALYERTTWPMPNCWPLLEVWDVLIRRLDTRTAHVNVDINAHVLLWFVGGFLVTCVCGSARRSVARGRAR